MQQQSEEFLNYYCIQNGYSAEEIDDEQIVESYSERDHLRSEFLRRDSDYHNREKQYDRQQYDARNFPSDLKSNSCSNATDGQQSGQKQQVIPKTTILSTTRNYFPTTPDTVSESNNILPAIKQHSSLHLQSADIFSTNAITSTSSGEQFFCRNSSS